MVSNDGSDESNCMSNYEAWGKIADICPRMGETANPGNALNAEIDHIPTNVIKGIVPRPVSIFINNFFIKENNTLPRMFIRLFF